MADEFPPNSFRSKEEKVPGTSNRAAAEPRKVERIVKGEVIQRKRPLGKRAKDIFFGGDAKGALGFAAINVIIPAAKDMLADAAQQAVEQMIFGESRGRSRGRFSGSGPVRYDGYAQSQRSTGGWSPGRPEPRREVSARGRSMHDFGEIFLESRGEAEQVIDTLIEIISNYNQATIADLYDLVGTTSAYTDQKYGWTDLRGANVQHARGGVYLLNLPKPIPLD